MNHQPEDFSQLQSRLTETARASLERAGLIAHRAGLPFVGTEHILLGILAQNASLGAQVLASSGVTLDRVESVIDLTPQAIKIVVSQNGIDREVLEMIRTAWEIAVEFGQEFIGTEHLIYSMLTQDTTRATKLLVDMNIDIAAVRDDLEDVFERQKSELSATMTTKKRATELGALERYGYDLTRRAEQNELDPVVGREAQIQRMITILGRRSKNNPVLIGEPGVGKTAIVEGLAQRIAEGHVPATLRGKRLVQLDLTAMVAGTKYRGQFEERLQKVLQALNKHPEVIVFIDEIHLLVGAGSAEGSMDAANVLKPALARGEIRMIGATTFDEYRRHIEKDAALGRRFQTVVVDEPDTETAVAMLSGLAERLADHHRVTIDLATVRQAVALSERYINERFLPDKAIDVIDEAAALLRSEVVDVPTDQQRLEAQIRRLARRIDQAVEDENYQQAATLKVQMIGLEQQAEQLIEVDEARPVLNDHHLRRAVSAMTGVPIKQLDKHTMRALKNLDKRLSQRVIGQDEAVSLLARAIRRAESGLGRGRRPMGSFVFLGPTGVGKTELARAVADEVFGGTNHLIKIDMSEFSEKHTAARLVGAPAGYVGYDDGGQLIERLRRQPYSVVLFDEIDKAHPDVLTMLLQILEDGQLSDAHGKTASFRQAIVILTSNVGAEKMAREAQLGFSGGGSQRRLDDLHQRNERAARKELERLLRPELINRFDAIINFRALNRKDASKIFDRFVSDIASDLGTHQRQLTVTPAAKRQLIEQGFSEAYGARELRRVVEQQIGDRLSDELIGGHSRVGDELEIVIKNKQVVLSVQAK